MISCDDILTGGGDILTGGGDILTGGESLTGGGTMIDYAAQHRCRAAQSTRTVERGTRPPRQRRGPSLGLIHIQLSSKLFIP